MKAGVSNESDYSKYLISLNDDITKFLDFDLFANSVIDKTVADNEYNGISEKIKDSISKGIIKSENDLLSDEDANRLVKYVSKTIYDGASDDESMKKAASYIISNFSEGLDIAVEDFQSKDKTSILASVEQIKKDLSSAFNKLGSVYNEIFEQDSDMSEIKFSLANVDNDMLSGIKEAFCELEDFDTSNLETFFKVLTNEQSTAEQVQQAFNDIATAYLNSTTT